MTNYAVSHTLPLAAMAHVYDDHESPLGPRPLAEISKPVPRTACRYLAIAVRTARVRVGTFVELDAALAVDEQRAVRSEVVQCHAYEATHVSQFP